MIGHIQEVECRRHVQTWGFEVGLTDYHYHYCYHSIGMLSDKGARRMLLDKKSKAKYPHACCLAKNLKETVTCMLLDKTSKQNHHTHAYGTRTKGNESCMLAALPCQMVLKIAVCV